MRFIHILAMFSGCVAGALCGCSSGDDSPAPVSDNGQLEVEDSTLSEVEDSSEEDTAQPEDITPDVPNDESTSDITDTADTEPPEDSTEPVDTGPQFPESPQSQELSEAVQGEIKGLLEPSEAGPQVSYVAVWGEELIAQTVDEESLLALTHFKNGKWYPIDTDMGPIKTSMAVGQNLLFASDNGVYVVDKGFVFLSPVNELVAEGGVQSMVNGPAGDEATFWYSDANGIHHWKADFVYDWTPGDLPAANALLAYGPAFNGVSALWAYADGWLYAMIQDEEEQLTAYPVAEDLDVSAMHADGAGQLWLLKADGSLLKRNDKAVWEWLSLPEPVLQISAVSAAQDLWLRTATQLIHQQYNIYRPVEGALPPSYVSAEAPGQVLMASADKIFRVWTEAPEKPAEITWTIDIEPLFLDRCSKCHGENGIAKELVTREVWVENIDAILDEITTDMPADDPPLDGDSVELIEAWIAGGFLE